MMFEADFPCDVTRQLTIALTVDKRSPCLKKNIAKLCAENAGELKRLRNSFCRKSFEN